MTLPHVTAYSAALYSTWVFVEDWRLLFDAGDGVATSLQGKARKIRHVAITHPDRDHMTGLFQLNHHNSDSIERLYYPADSGSFPTTKAFLNQFDPETAGGFDWQPARQGDRFIIGPNLFLEALENRHLPSSEGKVKSLSYRVAREKKKLKAEFVGLTGQEMAELRLKQSEAELFDLEERTLLAYSGDTLPEPPEKWTGAEILFHEATFLERERGTRADLEGNHTILEDALDIASGAKPKVLVLFHVSTRYGLEDVRESIRQRSSQLGISFPIYLIEPGRVVRDLFAEAPVWVP